MKTHKPTSPPSRLGMRSVVCKEGNRGWWVSSLLILYVLGYFNGNQEILVTITLFDQYLTVDMTYSPQKELSTIDPATQPPAHFDKL